jgi:hypothetical protein
MPVINVAPFVIKDAVLSIATDQYEKHVSGVLFTPNTSGITWQGMTPDSAFSDSSNPTWTCQLDYAQDWTTANSLAQYLLANAGQQKVCVFKPLGATTGKPLFTATLLIVPGPIGGAVNAVQTATVTMGVIGQPVKSVAP